MSIKFMSKNFFNEDYITNFENSINTIKEFLFYHYNKFEDIYEKLDELDSMEEKKTYIKKNKIMFKDASIDHFLDIYNLYNTDIYNIILLFEKIINDKKEWLLNDQTSDE